MDDTLWVGIEESDTGDLRPEMFLYHTAIFRESSSPLNALSEMD